MRQDDSSQPDIENVRGARHPLPPCRFTAAGNLVDVVQPWYQRTDRREVSDSACVQFSLLVDRDMYWQKSLACCAACESRYAARRAVDKVRTGAILDVRPTSSRNGRWSEAKRTS